MTGGERIPVSAPGLGGEERPYIEECLVNGWVSGESPMVKRFEERFAERCGRRHGVAVSSGTRALELAIAALGLRPGDEVILPTFTIISCVLAVLRAGATPVLVDSDPRTWNMRVDEVARRVTPRTKAIMIVHLYGLPADADPILELAQSRGIRVLEDAAQMHGQVYNGRPCGSLGDVSAFSFYANKLLTTGEGGMILTDDDRVAAACRSLRSLCHISGQRFHHDELGLSARFSSMQAALGLGQLDRLPLAVKSRHEMGRRYRELLADVSSVELPVATTAYAQNLYWAFGVVLRPEVPVDADAIRGRMDADGIETRPFFWPLHEQPILRRLGLFQGESYPVAERLARRGFYLPSSGRLPPADLERVTASLKRALGAAVR